MNLPFADAVLARYVNRRSAAGVPSIAAFDRSAARRILLVLTTGLGDAVLSTPVFPAVRAAFPGAQVRLFVRAAWAPLFEADPDLDGLIRYEGKYRRFFATLRALRDFQPDLALVLHGNDPDIVPLAFLAGSRFIVRIPTEGTRFRHLLANRERAQDARTVPGWHYVDNRLRILDTIGAPAAGRAPRVRLPPGLRNPAADRSPYWVLHAFAADPYKTWPRAGAFLADALKRYPQHNVILTGGPADRAEAERLAGSLERVHVMAGESSILETAAVLAGAECVVAPDTGILHLAAALDRPVVGLYAPTSAALVGPRSPGAPALVVQEPPLHAPCLEKRCPHVPECCMNRIQPAAVLEALAEQLR